MLKTETLIQTRSKAINLPAMEDLYSLCEEQTNWQFIIKLILDYLIETLRNKKNAK